MIQREDIVLLAGTGLGAALIALGHTTEGLYLIAGGGIGKAVIPAISPGVQVQSPSPVTKVVDGKTYVVQADGSLKPQ